MSIEPQYVVRADLVVIGVPLLRAGEDFNKFRLRLDGDLIPQTGTDVAVRTLNLPLERITLQLSPARSILARDYPDLMNLSRDIGRLADVAHAVIQSTRPGDREVPGSSYGYNMQVVYKQEGSLAGMEYLGNHLLKHNAIYEGERKLVGGFATVVLADEAAQWTFRAEPWQAGGLEDNRLSLAVNVHIPRPEGLPDRNGIVETLMEVWREAKSFMEYSDERGVG